MPSRFLHPFTTSLSASLKEKFSYIELLTIMLCFVIIAAFIYTSSSFFQPLTSLKKEPIVLHASALPYYGMRTVLRMLIGLIVSLLFTFIYATWAAKSKKASYLLVPILDILQSIPVLGFISATSFFFISITKGRILGAELISIFAVFTAQAWNMAFSFYQSLKTVPRNMQDVSKNLGLGAWQRFWYVEVPFAMPSLIWNMMLSMSGAWFFVVASEAFSIGNNQVLLPGIGSYISLALKEKSFLHLSLGCLTMFIMIILYDQLLFRPLIAWADRFRLDITNDHIPPRSWLFTMLARSQILHSLIVKPAHYIININLKKKPIQYTKKTINPFLKNVIFYGLCLLLIIYVMYLVSNHLIPILTIQEIIKTAHLGLFTMIRVLTLIIISSVIWVPIGLWIGLHKNLANIAQPIIQFLAAFPANLLFPFATALINAGHLNPDIWLSGLMILGAQWYILFNVIAGASAIPQEIHYVAKNFHITGFLWWKKIALPAIAPYYITGIITASGAAWNASIVSEYVVWGKTQFIAHGLGAYIQQATISGNSCAITIGVMMMSFFVVLLNYLLWSPLLRFSERKFTLNL